MPVGETGVQKARANQREGDHPVCTSLRGRSGIPVELAKRPLPGVRGGAPSFGSRSLLDPRASQLSASEPALTRVPMPKKGRELALDATDI